MSNWPSATDLPLGSRSSTRMQAPLSTLEVYDRAQLCSLLPASPIACLLRSTASELVPCGSFRSSRCTKCTSGPSSRRCVRSRRTLTSCGGAISTNPAISNASQQPSSSSRQPPFSAWFQKPWCRRRCRRRASCSPRSKRLQTMPSVAEYSTASESRYEKSVDSLRKPAKMRGQWPTARISVGVRIQSLESPHCVPIRCTVEIPVFGSASQKAPTSLRPSLSSSRQWIAAFFVVKRRPQSSRSSFAASSSVSRRISSKRISQSMPSFGNETPIVLSFKISS
mmetsp:Transcript_32597/g.114638  ORF Transcript_32597/g.114638 Transcript_32597/m.114638 type:complete len:281 (-) Transcript_32597:475-1317(-)